VQQTAAKNTQPEGLYLYMAIGSYESAINKYAHPYNPGYWNKYKKLKQKILQWQQQIS